MRIEAKIEVIDQLYLPKFPGFGVGSIHESTESKRGSPAFRDVEGAVPYTDPA